MAAAVLTAIAAAQEVLFGKDQKTFGSGVKITILHFGRAVEATHVVVLFVIGHCAAKISISALCRGAAMNYCTNHFSVRPLVPFSKRITYTPAGSSPLLIAE